MSSSSNRLWKRFRRRVICRVCLFRGVEKRPSFLSLVASNACARFARPAHQSRERNRTQNSVEAVPKNLQSPAVRYSMMRMRCCFLPGLRSRVCFVRGDRQSVLSFAGCVYFRDHERRGMVFQDKALSRFGPFTTPPPRSQQCGI